MKKPAKTCLVLHKKSCTRPEVKAAVKHVRESGIEVDVHIPWSRKDLRRFVRQAIKDGAQLIVDPLRFPVLSASSVCGSWSRCREEINHVRFLSAQQLDLTAHIEIC